MKARPNAANRRIRCSIPMKTVDLIARTESGRLHARDLIRIQADRVARMAKWLTITCIGLVAALVLTACGGGGGGASASAGAASNVATVAPVITTQPANLTVTTGQVANFSVVASGSGPLQYQWKRNAAAITGATSSSYAINSAAAGDNGAVFSVTVQNSAGNISSQGATLTVNPAASAPQITTTTLPVGVVNSFYQGTLRQSGGTAPYTWIVTSSSLPAGLSLAASGVISGTPTATGTSAITFTVRDANGLSSSANLTIAVNSAALPAPQVSTSALPSGVVNSAYQANLVASSGTSPYTWSVTGGTLPTGLQLTAATGSISGTPTKAGTSAITFTVRDANAQTATANLSIVVTAAVPPLTIATKTLPAGSVNSAYQTTLQGSGGTAPYTWSVTGGSLPGGLALNTTSGVVSGTPTTEGTSPVTFTVRDSKGLTVSASLSIVVGPAATVVAAPFKHVVMVLMENTDYADVVGNTTDMPYLNSLISGYGLASKYYANTHPSIGNYFMLVTGQILTDDDAMTPRNFPVTVDNVVRQLEKNGKTWKAYAEDLPSVGYTGVGSGYYIVRHVPLAYLSDVTATTASKQNLVPFTQFATDLAAGTLPNYSFVSPNGCNMAHDCSLATGDAWLKKNIAPLLTSTPFKDDGLLIIVFDEGNTDNTNGGGRVVANLVSPTFSKKGYVSTTKYQHESMLRLTLEGLGVTTFPGAAATAPRMWEFFNVTAP